MSRDYINDSAEDAAFSLRRISSTLDDIYSVMVVPPPTIPEAKVKEAAILVVQMLEARIPQRGDEDDIGFEDEHAAIENLLAMFDAP